MYNTQVTTFKKETDCPLLLSCPFPLKWGIDVMLMASLSRVDKDNTLKA